MTTESNNGGGSSVEMPSTSVVGPWKTLSKTPIWSVDEVSFCARTTAVEQVSNRRESKPRWKPLNAVMPEVASEVFCQSRPPSSERSSSQSNRRKNHVNKKKPPTAPIDLDEGNKKTERIVSVSRWQLMLCIRAQIEFYFSV